MTHPRYRPERIFIPALFCEGWFQLDDGSPVRGPFYTWVGDTTDHDPGDEDPSDGIAVARSLRVRHADQIRFH